MNKILLAPLFYSLTPYLPRLWDYDEVKYLPQKLATKPALSAVLSDSSQVTLLIPALELIFQVNYLFTELTSKFSHFLRVWNLGLQH